MKLGAALLAALGVLAGLLAWMFPKPSRRTRVLLGSACLALLLLAMVLSLNGGEKGSSKASTAGTETIEEAGHDWPVLATAWTVPSVDTIEAGPIATGDHLVVRTSHRRIQVFNGENGTSAWPPYVTRTDTYILAVVGKRVIFVDRDIMVALSVVDGKRLWEQNLKDFYTSSDVVVTRDLILIKDGPRLRALDVATGKPRWTWDSKQASLKEVVAIDQSVYVADEAGRIYGLDLKGKRRWTYMIPHGDPVELPILAYKNTAQPMVAVGKVLLFPAGPGGNVYALSTDTRQELWHQSFGEVRAISPSNGQALVVTPNKVVAMDAPSGKELWSHDIDNAVVTTQRVYGVTYDLVNSKLHFVAIDVDGGKEVWGTVLDLYAFPEYEPIWTGVFVYFTDRYALYMLDPATGKPRGIYKQSDASIGSSGTNIEVEVGNLIVVNIGDRLIALRRS
jgi:outer membrane protein assembly factor BamB